MVPDRAHVLWPVAVVMMCGWFKYLRKRICDRSRALGRVIHVIIGDNQEPRQVGITCLLCLTRFWKTRSETKGHTVSSCHSVALLLCSLHSTMWDLHVQRGGGGRGGSGGVLWHNLQGLTLVPKVSTSFETSIHDTFLRALLLL